jgi:transcriptional regulator with XRE-family HTH domain
MENEIINNSKYIGKKLKELRHIKELTIDEVAAKTQLSKSYITYIEKGERKIKGLQLRKLLAIYSYPLGKFLSDILDEYKDYKYEPDAILQKSEHSILLDGYYSASAIYIKLLRPIRSKDDIEILELYLPGNTQLPIDDNILIRAEIRGIVTEGTLLIIIENNEFEAIKGVEFCVKADKPHYYRNASSYPTKVILIITPPAF